MVDGMPPANRPHVGMDRAVESSHQKGKRSKSPDSTLRSPSSPIHEEDEEKLSEDSDSQPALGGGELVVRETSSPESVAGEEMEDSSSLQKSGCPPSVEDVLQDGGCGEHRSLTQSDTDPPVDVYLPGSSDFTQTPPGRGSASPTQPLLFEQTRLHLEDEHRLS